MASKNSTIDITLVDKEGSFNTILNRFNKKDEEYDFKSLSLLRRLLSNEKARLLHTIKTKKPKSIYHLAKILKRDFKSVMEDIKLLDKFGFIYLVSEKTGKRVRHKPVIAIETLSIQIKI